MSNQRLFGIMISLAFGLSMLLPAAHTKAREFGKPSRSVVHLRPGNSFVGAVKDDDESLTLLPSKTILLKGRSIDFRARIGDDDDDSKDVTRRIKDWTSSDPTVATINDDGRLVALKIGSTIISASYKRLRATAQVTVDEVSAATFVVQPGDTKVNALITPAIKVTVQDNLGRVLRGLRVTLGTAPLPSNPPGILSGTLTRTTDVNGVVAFDDLKLNWLGAYALQATVNTPTGPFISVSNLFNELPVNPCLASAPAEEAFCKFPTGQCQDSDGDGLSDDWEAAGGIDFDGDGIVADWTRLFLTGPSTPLPAPIPPSKTFSSSTTGWRCRTSLPTDSRPPARSIRCRFQGMFSIHITATSVHLTRFVLRANAGDTVTRPTRRRSGW